MATAFALLVVGVWAWCSLQAAAVEATMLPAGHAAAGLDAGPGRRLLADTCAAQGLEGVCSGKCCCCFSGGAGIVTYEPTDDCQCQRVVKTSQIWATVVLSVVLVAGGLLLQLYFGSSLPVSPYPNSRQRNPRRGGRITPDGGMAPPPEVQMASR